MIIYSSSHKSFLFNETLVAIFSFFTMRWLSLGSQQSIVELNMVRFTNNRIREQDRKERAMPKEGIKEIAQKVWNAIAPEYLRRLYKSMPRRMVAVIASQEGDTKC